MDVNDFSYEDEMDAAIVGALSACVVVLEMRNLLHDTIHITVHEQLLMFLHTIAHNVRNGVMCVNYLRSGETVSRYFNHVLKALRQLYNDYIRPPDTAIPDEISSREIYWPWFKDCVGAIDGTHILASVPSDIVGRFRGKSGKPTQNALAAVRFDLTFSYVLAGWEGSAHDVLVLNDALQRQNRLIVPNE